MVAVNPASFDGRDAQPLDDLLGRVSSVDEVLKGLFPEGMSDEARAADQLRFQEQGALFARVFSTPDGRAALEVLCDLSLRRPTFIGHMNLDPMRAYAQGVQREGQNSLVWMIISMIAAGHSQTPPQREGV